jgi:lipopolysaccharide/colanic/teichoic acid biosynthesis glycosyltransferase
VKPGITDYASIRFRNEGEILQGHADPDEAYRVLIRGEKMRLGLMYAQQASLWVDMRILVDTALALVGVPMRRSPSGGHSADLTQPERRSAP